MGDRTIGLFKCYLELLLLRQLLGKKMILEGTFPVLVVMEAVC